MIKLMRESAHKYPWLLKSIMWTLALAFVITMGWWGFGETSSNAVASVGSLTVSREEFRRNYENTYRFYKDTIKGEIKEEEIKQFVIEGLVENKLWTLAAEEMGLSISPQELREDIMNRQDFQQNGKFDPDFYRRLLAANRLTPPLFESLYSVELLSAKAKMVIRDAVALTPAEIAEAQALMARQPQSESKDGLSANERILQDFLFQKQQRALLAYTQALKARIPIEIHREML